MGRNFRAFLLSFILGSILVFIYLNRTPRNVLPVEEIDTGIQNQIAEKKKNGVASKIKEIKVLSYSQSDEVSDRDFEEWQGMRPPEELPPCERDDGCGLAMACIDGQCTPCVEDQDCDLGERCSLQHCLLAENVTCKTRLDCNKEEFCVLSGYSFGPRSNKNMKAYCQGLLDGPTPDPDEREQLEAGRGPQQKAPFDFPDLRKGLTYEKN